MSEHSKKTEYDLKYARDNIHRIPLDVQKDFYKKIKASAESVGESVNGYIKKAIKMRMESEKNDK